MAYGFYFDSSKCTGCKSCQVACKESHKLGIRNLWRRVYNYQNGSWERTEVGTYIPKDVFGYFVSVSCNHCETPACLGNCPTGAIAKDDKTGIVTIDKEVCIGCKTCITACPYGAPTFVEETGLVTKCDMCVDEIGLGRKPICVATCPMRALDWGDLDELRERYGNGDVEIEPLPKNTTGPSLILSPHPAAQAAGTGSGMVVNLAEELDLA